MRRIFFLFLGLPLLAFAEGGLPNQPYIYVEGNAEIEKPADMATLAFNVVARNPDQIKANQEVQGKATKILNLLDERKIPQTDVVAADLKSEPQYEREDEPRPNRGKIIGYRVNRSFTVKLREVQMLPKLVDDLLAIAGVEFASIESGLKSEKEVDDEAWDKALLDAQRQAEKTVKSLSMKIDSIFAISPVAIPEITGKLLRRGERVVVTGSYVSAPETIDAARYRLEAIKVTQSVHVIYLISPAK